jgi:hypothetical protein
MLSSFHVKTYFRSLAPLRFTELRRFAPCHPFILIPEADEDGSAAAWAKADVTILTFDDV